MVTADNRPQNRRTRLASADITGVLAGLTRAIVDALLHYLTTNC